MQKKNKQPLDTSSGNRMTFNLTENDAQTAQLKFFLGPVSPLTTTRCRFEEGARVGLACGYL